VDRLDLHRPDVLEEVCRHEEELLQRRKLREDITFGVVAGGLGLVIGEVFYFAFAADDTLHRDWRERPSSDARLWILAGFLVGAAVVSVVRRIYVALRPDCASVRHRTYQPRLAEELGRDPPSVGSLTQLLQALGARVDG
jgi:hypothetical protein